MQSGLFWWIRHYRAHMLGGDTMAGVITAMLLVPQAMAYASLAGLPPQLGLYASILPLIAYALLGSSMVLAVGPVAVVSLMTFSTLSPLFTPGSAEYIAAAAVLALLSGSMMLLFGLLGLGAVARYLSHPVISGFVSAAALVIIISQLQPLLGISASGSTPLATAWSLFQQLPHSQLFTASLGLGSLALLLTTRHFLPALLEHAGVAMPSALTLSRLAPMAVVLLSAALVATLGWQENTAVVGEIPDELPSLQMPPQIEASQLIQLALPALLISLIGFMESASIAQSYASRRRQSLDNNAELRGLGLANLASAISGAFPVTGGFSRTVVNAEAGACTPLSGLFTAALVALIVSFASPLFGPVPKAVLAAVIIAAVAGLIDWQTFRHVWRYDRLEGMTLLGTAVSVLTLGVEAGIAAGLALSLLALLWHASHPHMAVLGQVPGSEHFRNILRHRVNTDPERLLVRIDENLFFGNASAVQTRLHALLRDQPAIRHLILVMSSVSRIDATALDMLKALNIDLAEQNIMLHLAEIKGPVLDRLDGSDFLARLTGHVYLSTYHAFTAQLLETPPDTLSGAQHDHSSEAKPN